MNRHGPARPRTGWLSGRAAAAGSRCSARRSSRRARPSQSRPGPAASPSCRSPSTRRAARRRPPERRDTRLTPRRARSSGADVRGRRRRRAGISLVRAAGAPQRGPPLAGLFDGRRRLGRPPRAADVCAVGGVGAPFLSQWGTSPERRDHASSAREADGEKESGRRKMCVSSHVACFRNGSALLRTRERRSGVFIFSRYLFLCM